MYPPTKYNGIETHPAGEVDPGDPTATITFAELCETQVLVIEMCDDRADKQSAGRCFASLNIPWIGTHVFLSLRSLLACHIETLKPSAYIDVPSFEQPEAPIGA